jgi:MurNAc alpha-1-phosphate uridylyltransferase
MSPDGRLRERAEHEIAPFIYTGFGIVKPSLFEAPASDVFPLAPFFFAAARAGRLFGQRLDGLWLHVGTPDAIKDAEREMARGIM